MARTNQGREYREQVGAAARGLTLLDHLAGTWRHSSREQWRERIDRGRVRVDGDPAQPDQILGAGQWIVWRRPPWREPSVPLSFAIVYRDAQLLAVAKPRGLPTLPGGGRFQEHTLLHQVRRRVPGATPVHRLGTGTSGLVLFALDRDSRRELGAAFRAGRVRREYRAWIEGRPAWSERTLRDPLGPVPYPPLGTVQGVTPAGRPAETRVEILAPRGDGCLARVLIGTGRAHQIRIHLAAAGHPLVGDPLYERGGRPRPGSRALPSDPGYHLHALALEVPRPAAAAPLTLECTPPALLRTDTG